MSHDPPIPAPPSSPDPASSRAVGEPPISPIDTPRNFGDTAAEYAALRHDPNQARGTAPSGGAIVVDRSYRSRGTFAGSKAREVLNGLVTNDVVALAPGEGCYAVALTPKGRILSDVRLFVREEDVLVDLPPRGAPGWWGMIRKYVNPRLSRYADVSASTCELGVFGTRAHAVVAAALGVEWETLAHMPLLTHRTIEARGTRLHLARVPDLGLEGYSLFFPAESKAAIAEALVASGGRPAGLDAVEIARIEAGRPEWGVEMDESTLAQEANMEELHAVSFTKGCYTGQETVARVHFRGHVNRHLRGIRFDEVEMPPRGIELRDAGGKVVGDVRSAIVSPRLGGIGIAMIRREVAVGNEVSIQLGDAVIRATVVPLPFPMG